MRDGSGSDIGGEGGGLQNSAAAASSALVAFSGNSRQRHSHSGYSSSASATGSCFPLIKFSPVRTVPAGHEDLGSVADSVAGGGAPGGRGGGGWGAAAGATPAAVVGVESVAAAGSAAQRRAGRVESGRARKGWRATVVVARRRHWRQIMAARWVWMRRERVSVRRCRVGVVSGLRVEDWTWSCSVRGGKNLGGSLGNLAQVWLFEPHTVFTSSGRALNSHLHATSKTKTSSHNRGAHHSGLRTMLPDT